MPEGLPGGGMLKLRFDLYITPLQKGDVSFQFARGQYGGRIEVLTSWDLVLYSVFYVVIKGQNIRILSLLNMAKTRKRSGPEKTTKKSNSSMNPGKLVHVFIFIKPTKLEIFEPF